MTQNILDNDSVHREIIRIWKLPDRWLGEEILKLTRNLRDSFPKELGDPSKGHIASGLTWHVIPELARRLGSTRLLPNESNNIVLRSARNEMRGVVAACLEKHEMQSWQPFRKEADQIMAFDLLLRSPVQGNPIVFAIDRLVPPSLKYENQNDKIACAIRKANREQGFTVSPLWSPELIHIM